jgi:hypothetical protein
MSVTLESDDLTENEISSSFNGIWICRTPYNKETGQYSCPYCEFTSDNVEDFAIGMCWDCVQDEAATCVGVTKEEVCGNQE